MRVGRLERENKTQNEEIRRLKLELQEFSTRNEKFAVKRCSSSERGIGVPSVQRKLNVRLFSNSGLTVPRDAMMRFEHTPFDPRLPLPGSRSLQGHPSQPPQ